MGGLNTTTGIGGDECLSGNEAITISELDCDQGHELCTERSAEPETLCGLVSAGICSSARHNVPFSYDLHAEPELSVLIHEELLEFSGPRSRAVHFFLVGNALGQTVPLHSVDFPVLQVGPYRICGRLG